MFPWRKILASPNVLSAFADAVVLHPDATAILCDGDRISFAQLDNQSRTAAGALQGFGFDGGDRIGLMLGNGPEFVRSFLAIARLGAMAVPLDSHYAGPELVSRILDTGCRAVVAEASFVPRLKETLDASVQIILARDLVAQVTMSKEREAARPVKPRPADPLVCLSTGGSLGAPNAMVLTHRLAYERSTALWKRAPLAPHDLVFNLSPLFRGPALLTAMLPSLMAGATLVLPRRFDVSQTLDFLAAQDVKVLHANPFHYAALAHADGPARDLSHIRRCFSSGNKLSRAVADRLKSRHGIFIHERYATAEVGGIATNGRLLPDVRVRLVSDHGKRVKIPDTMGEIMVKSPWMVSGYMGAPARSCTAFQGGWFHTGDYGRFGADGRLEIIRRKKAALQCGNRLIYADDIHDCLVTHECVRRAMVVKRRTDTAALGFTAYVVPSGGVTIAELCNHCRAILGDDAALVDVVLRSELPRSWKTLAARAEAAYPRWGEV